MYALSPTFLCVLVDVVCLQTGQSTLADEAPSEPSGVTCSTTGVAVGYGGGTSDLDIVSVADEVSGSWCVADVVVLRMALLTGLA